MGVRVGKTSAHARALHTVESTNHGHRVHTLTMTYARGRIMYSDAVNIADHTIYYVSTDLPHRFCARCRASPDDRRGTRPLAPARSRPRRRRARRRRAAPALSRPPTALGASKLRSRTTCRPTARAPKCSAPPRPRRALSCFLRSVLGLSRVVWRPPTCRAREYLYQSVQRESRRAHRQHV